MAPTALRKHAKKKEIMITLNTILGFFFFFFFPLILYMRVFNQNLNKRKGIKMNKFQKGKKRRAH